jgi:hypothetical protein
VRIALSLSACPQCCSVAGGRLIEIAMQEVYREPSYYEGGESGYADTSYAAQEFALRAMFQRLLQNLAKRGLTGGDLLEVGCGYGHLLDEARFLRSILTTDEIRWRSMKNLT